MADPLTALRDAYRAGVVIERDGNGYRIGDRRFPSDMSTAYRSNRGKGEPYSLDALAVLMQLQTDQRVKYSDYFRVCRDHGVKKAVAINDLKDVLSYLTGATSQSDYIDVALLLEQKGTTSVAEARTEEVPASAVLGVSSSKSNFRSDELLLFSRDSIMRNPKKDFALALRTIDAIWKDDARNESRTTSKRLRSSSSTPKPVRKGIPIIIVPTSLASVVTIYNALEFFQEGRWVSSNEKRQSAKAMPDKVVISRKSGVSDKYVKYEIYHDAASFNMDMWRRVVCVVVQGQSWQFKDWKIGKTPQEVFERVYCCYLHFDDEKSHPNIATWGVKSFSVSKTRRHLTTSVYHTLWNNIEQRIVAHKADAVIF